MKPCRPLLAVATLGMLSAAGWADDPLPSPSAVDPLLAKSLTVDEAWTIVAEQAGRPSASVPLGQADSVVAALGSLKPDKEPRPRWRTSWVRVPPSVTASPRARRYTMRRPGTNVL